MRLYIVLKSLKAEGHTKPVLRREPFPQGMIHLPEQDPDLCPHRDKGILKTLISGNLKSRADVEAEDQDLPGDHIYRPDLKFEI